MKQSEKIEKLINENKITLETDTPHYLYFKVKGLSDKMYEIIFNKRTNKYSCTCNNVRNSECYHIVAIKKQINDKLDLSEMIH